MRSLPMKDFTFDVCDACGGVWFDEEELKKTAHVFAGGIPAHVEEYSQIVKENDVPPATTVPKKEWPHEDGIPCPLDGAKTQKFVYAGDSGIIFEKCSSCGGMWFDGDELVHLAEYVKPSAKDLMGKLLIQEIKEGEKANEKLKQLPLLPLKIVGAFSSPVFLAASVLHFLVKDVGLDLGREYKLPPRMQ